MGLKRKQVEMGGEESATAQGRKTRQSDIANGPDGLRAVLADSVNRALVDSSQAPLCLGGSWHAHEDASVWQINGDSPFQRRGTLVEWLGRR